MRVSRWCKGFLSVYFVYTDFHILPVCMGCHPFFNNTFGWLSALKEIAPSCVCMNVCVCMVPSEKQKEFPPHPWCSWDLLQDGIRYSPDHIIKWINAADIVRSLIRNCGQRTGSATIQQTQSWEQLLSLKQLGSAGKCSPNLLLSLNCWVTTGFEDATLVFSPHSEQLEMSTTLILFFIFWICFYILYLFFSSWLPPRF